MLISTEIHSTAKLIGEEKAIECLAKAGFDAWDFSMFNMIRYNWDTKTLMDHTHPLIGSDYLSFARKLRRIGEDNGIHCNQAHAPFPVTIPIVRSDYLKRSIECIAEAGGKICTIHPDNDKSAAENAEMYQELLPFAKAHGVKIAAENMYNWDKTLDQASPAACSSPEDFVKHLEAVNDPDFVACLDLGHAQMRGLHTSAPEMIHALGAHLQALHIHDNDQWHDSHNIPFSMNMDFATIVKALKEIGYSGYFTLEADQYYNRAGFDADHVLEGAKNLAAAARKLADMFMEA